MFNLMLAEWTVNANQMLIGLLIGVVVLILLVTMTKLPAFLAIIVSALLIALIGGVPGDAVPGLITDGFGGTLGTIGIIIGFGVVMGRIFEVSGAAEQMARSFIKLFGKGREELALTITGFIISIPIFCDSAFVILFPISKAISQKTRKNLVVLAGALAMGLVVTHSVVPPTPGPLFVAEAFGVNLGLMIMWGLLLSIPMVTAGVLWIRWVGKNLIIVPDEEGNHVRLDVADKNIADFDLSEEPSKDLPSTFMSFAPIAVPIVLILLNQVLDGFVGLSGFWAEFFGFVGSPVPAVAIGVIIAIYGLGYNMDRETALNRMQEGMRSAGVILLVTGAGGALGNVIQTTGVGDTIAQGIADWGIPALLVPFLISTIIRFIQGSGTVALVTSATISAPILASLDVSPVFAALAAMVGSIFFGYFNDSYFHVVNRSIGIRAPKEQLKFWSGATTAAWAAGFITVVILNAIFGGFVGV
ncbi:MAG: GntP family permease [Bacillota bacterium]